ncbi:hypothetical protein Nepgr_001106 [Nepenthes gracilis]|uniref:tRNA pseudouridine synthase n=1 Tax=Nepenthes gracilis TaxID=150966 RepID=A0AAD3RVV1_NEPGR|nr:hypothetical protein Nepgr_001106 [Nepenthes gracilis]
MVESPLKAHSTSVVEPIMEENQTQSKVYHHYAHTDSCRFSRWTARECHQYMYARPWQRVNDFYSDLVNGRSSLSDLFSAENKPSQLHCMDDGESPRTFGEYEMAPSISKDQSGRWKRVTFKIVISYHGESFDGWQKQPCLNTVQGLVERSIGSFLDDKKAQQLKDKGLPVEGIAVVAGRTDKGVTALNQVCSFYTWRKDVEARDIKNSINIAAVGKLRVVSISQVSRAFHPNFCAKWRRYLYIFPFNDGEDDEQNNLSEKGEVNLFLNNCQYEQRHEINGHFAEENAENSVNNNRELEGQKKPTSFSITKVDKLLRQLEGKLLSYKVFARDTKASRSVGPPSECFLYHARAIEAELPCSAKDHKHATKIVCVELVANRFLRKMVRVLVATAIREAAAGAEEDMLLELMDAACRRATAPPAPPNGLCLVDVGYADFDRKKCFIC